MPGDAGQGSRVDVVALGRTAVTPGDLAGPPPAGVGIGQPGPPRFGQIPGGLAAPVVQAKDAPKTKAECEKMTNMKWDDATKACVKK